MYEKRIVIRLFYIIYLTRSKKSIFSLNLMVSSDYSILLSATVSEVTLSNRIFHLFFGCPLKIIARSMSSCTACLKLITGVAMLATLSPGFRSRTAPVTIIKRLRLQRFKRGMALAQGFLKKQLRLLLYVIISSKK